MNKIVFSTLAAGAFLSGAAFAQNGAPSSQQKPMAQQSQSTSISAMNDQQIADLWRASRIDNVNVYNNNDEKIGDISDILLDHNGKAVAVVIDVGGFLGIGTHRIALKFDDVKFSDMPRTRGARDQSEQSSATTTTTGSADRNAAATKAASDRERAATRMSPDHAIVNMTRDQLKALPQVRYSR